MNCIVCVTSVPDTASVIKIGADGNRIDETGIKWILGPYDEYALEEALGKPQVCELRKQHRRFNTKPLVDAGAWN